MSRPSPPLRSVPTGPIWIAVQACWRGRAERLQAGPELLRAREKLHAALRRSGHSMAERVQAASQQLLQARMPGQARSAPHTWGKLEACQ